MDTSISGNISFSTSGLVACRGRQVQVWRPRSGQLEVRLQMEGGKVCWVVGGTPTLIIRELCVLCRPSESERCGESVANASHGNGVLQVSSGVP